MDYDVLVLGGGIIGCAAAYELSKYNLNIAVIEKEYDIADDISFVNTAIVYDGSETSNNVMSGLEYIVNILLEDLCSRFNVPFKRIGALRVVNDENGVLKLKEMYDAQVRENADAKDELKRSRRYNGWMMVVSIISMLTAIASTVIPFLCEQLK